MARTVMLDDDVAEKLEKEAERTGTPAEEMVTRLCAFAGLRVINPLA